MPLNSWLPRKLLIAISFIFAVALPGRASEGPKTVVICDDVADPATLDPQKEFSEKNHTLLQQIYEGLVRFDSEGRIEPALAESWERLDPLRVRFHLRKGVQFHNGEPFTAEAVKLSIERYLNPATGFPAIGFIASIAKADVVDDNTIDLITNFPDGLLLNRLAGFVLIIPPSYAKDSNNVELSSHPIGTGAFVFEEWKKGDRIILSANKSYWMKGFPKIDRLVFRFIPSLQQIDKIISGEVDILTELPGTETLHVMESGVSRIIKKSSFYTTLGSFNRTSGPLSDVRVRRAFNYVVNRDEIIRYDLLNNGDPIATVSMLGEEGHNPNLKPYPFDLAKAQALMREAGYEKGFSLSILAKEQGRRTAGIIGKELEALKITSKIETTVDANLVSELTSHHWDMLIAACPDPMVHSFFIPSVFFYSKSPYAFSKDPIFDQSLEDMVITLDAKARAEKGMKLDRYIYDNALGIFTYQRIKTYGVSRKVSFTPYVTGMSYFYSLEKSK